MITAFYSLNRVMGAEYWIAGYIVCVFVYLASCLLFRHCRTRQGLRAVLLNLLLAEIIIDVAWFSIYFPSGEYYNHGISAVFGLFLWPAFLIISGIIVVAFSSPRRKADSELKKKLTILALVLLAIVAASLLMKNLSPLKARESNGLGLDEREALPTSPPKNTIICI